jgi:hypothetical protein
VGKTGTIERFIWKKFGDMGFLEFLSRSIRWFKFRFTLLYFRGTSKNKSSGFAAAMWAHAYLAMTFKRKVMRIKQDYLAQV